MNSNTNNRVRLLLGLCLILILGCTPVIAAELVREFSGKRSTNTGEFEVTAPWVLEWRVSGDYERDIALEVSLVESKTGVHHGYALQTRKLGNGVRLFDQSGIFRFQVNSTLVEWSLRVEQLSRKEAEGYTPVGRN